MRRHPAVAGQFYPGDPYQLRDQLDAMFAGQVNPEPALMAMCPHAGYVYSGATAAKVLGRVEIPARVLVAGPNHRGLGADAAVMSEGSWLTPLGEVRLDAELGRALAQASPLVSEDELAHRMEHSLEVQVPLLQHLRPEFMLTPLCLGRLSLSECLELGKALAGVIKAAGEPVLMVASTDMTHYESAAAAREKDEQALARVLELDPEGLYQTVAGGRISMCGVLPTTVCLAAAKELGASRAELVEYTNSGAVTGDDRQVVGYAGVLVR